MKLLVFFDWGKLIACQYQIESNLSKVSLKRHFMLLVYEWLVCIVQTPCQTVVDRLLFNCYVRSIFRAAFSAKQQRTDIDVQLLSETGQDA